jgi:hypothetical protein
MLPKIVSPTQFYFTFTAAGSNSTFGIRDLSLLSGLLAVSNSRINLDSFDCLWPICTGGVAINDSKDYGNVLPRCKGVGFCLKNKETTIRIQQRTRPSQCTGRRYAIMLLGTLAQRKGMNLRSLRGSLPVQVVLSDTNGHKHACMLGNFGECPPKIGGKRSVPLAHDRRRHMLL